MPLPSFQNSLFRAIRERWSGRYPFCIRSFNLNGDCIEGISGNAGTPTGLTYGTGKFGILQSGDFDGATSLINIGSAADIDNLAAFSIIAAIYPRSDGQADVGTIYRKGGNIRFECSLEVAGKICLYGAIDCLTTDATTLTKNLAADKLALNTWHLVMMTWSADKYVRIYRIGNDGRPYEFAYNSQVQGMGAQQDDAGQVGGVGNIATGGTAFDGFIDTFRLYNTALAKEYMGWFCETPLYLMEAPQNSPFPYVTCELIDNESSQGWGAKFWEKARIQFSVFAKGTGAMSAEEECLLIANGIKQCFDDGNLDPVGYSHIGTWREPERFSREDDVSRSDIEYVMEFQKV